MFIKDNQAVIGKMQELCALLLEDGSHGKTMKEMKLAEDMMAPLLEKMRFLVNKMTEKPNV